MVGFGQVPTYMVLSWRRAAYKGTLGTVPGGSGFQHLSDVRGLYSKVKGCLEWQTRVKGPSE